MAPRKAITSSLSVSVGWVWKERVLRIEWLQDKLAEAGTTIPQFKGPIARRCKGGLAFPGKPGAHLHPRGAGKATQVS
jgi:hypothetical protein